MSRNGIILTLFIYQRWCENYSDKWKSMFRVLIICPHWHGDDQIFKFFRIKPCRWIGYLHIVANSTKFAGLNHNIEFEFQEHSMMDWSNKWIQNFFARSVIVLKRVCHFRELHEYMILVFITKTLNLFFILVELLT